MSVPASTRTIAGSLVVEVAVPVPLRRTFAYDVPEALEHLVHSGAVVSVPFGRRKVSGFVVDVYRRESDAWRNASKAFAEDLKPIHAVLEPELALPDDLVALCRWVSDYYRAPLGEVFRAALPSGLGKKTPGDLPESTSGSAAAFTLSLEQEQAVATIAKAQAAERPSVFLLFGITGSGKTEVYLRAAENAVASGGKALILVPEIALSPQMVERVQARFGSRVALWHSSLTPTRRREVWSRARRGEIDVMVGARSAVFTPLSNLKLIVVDEEHESAYKQNESPRYHARDVAIVRARSGGAVTLLGSATPSLESMRNAERGKYELIRLPERVGGGTRSKVELVLLPHVAPREERLVSFILSDALREALLDTVSRGEQAILFLNRRGHSTVVQCETCRHPLRCGQCDIALTWHSDRDRVICHYCGQNRRTPDRCPSCNGMLFVFKGVGTQRVARELARLYPGVRVERLDTDSTRKRGSLETALARFRAHEADVLLGTQMVAKGLDFPEVTLVGVINADLQLSLPDFRSAERTFQLLTQVAGRSGRGPRPGRVIFQTNQSEHYALTAAAAQDYESFYRTELAARHDLSYPPHARLVNLLFDGRDEARVIAEAEATASVLREATRPVDRVDFLGPAPQPLSRLKGKYRWHLTLRGPEHKRLHELARLVEERAATRPRGVRIAVDVDPVSLL
ncbi:MAG TPA: primosomal protein N' [Candidatus Eisenbacteria bacterium]|nr:primosomal protein N' [Candidatus Eisenbacteria bacterium]